MKKEKIDDNQLTFFDVIDGGKHEEDKKNIMKFKKKQLIDVQYAPYEEMFSGFNKIQAITFSYDLSFINNIMKYFDTAEIILGAKFIFDKDEMLPRLLADAAALKNDITKDKRLSNMLKNGDLIIKVSTSIVDHRKLYILSADDGRTRVLSPSANLSWSAWNGSHLENYEYDDGEAGYEDAINDFEVAWSLAEEIPYACFSAKISENADEDIVAGNPIVTKIKQTNSVIVLRQQMDEETISLTRRCLDIENDIAEYKEVTKNIGLKTDKGVTMISPQHVKKIETNMKRTIRAKKLNVEEHTKAYPKLTFDYDEEKAYLDETEMDLNPPDEEIKNDIDEILKIFDNFKAFINGEKNLQPNHFKLMTAVLSSPFTARLRCDASLLQVGTSSLPLFLLLSSANANCGKTFMMSALLKMMTGETLDTQKGVNVSKDMLEKEQICIKGIPIFVDEISGRFISDKEDFLKNPERCEKGRVSTMPLIVFASNNVLSLEEKFRKRMMFINFDGAMPSTIDQSAYKSRGIAIVNRLGTAFFREYLRRMIPQINGIINYMYDVEHREDGYYPDVMAISSQTIIDILTDYGYDIPNYVKRLTWNDDYSVNSVSVSEDFLEQIDSLYRTNRKDFKIDTVTNLVSIELGRNKNIEKMFESWSRSLPNEIGATVIPSRDLCRIDFRKDKLEKFLGHSLSTGFLSFLQGKIGFGR